MRGTADEACGRLCLPQGTGLKSLLVNRADREKSWMQNGGKLELAGSCLSLPSLESE